MTMVRGQFSQLMAPGLHDIFVQWLDLKQRKEEFSHIFHMETTDNAFDDEVEFAAFVGGMPEKPEGEAFTYEDAVEGNSKRYESLSYGLGVRSSYELIKDDKYNLIMQVPKAIARAAHFTKEQLAWNVINLGFTSTKTLDGRPLFSAQHDLLGGAAATNTGPGLANVINAAGTYPNRPATDVDLSLTALQAGINTFERLIDASGMPITIIPKLLVIPPPLKYIAREILGSPHKPYTSDNEINALLEEDLHYFVGHYLTSDSAWFLLSDQESHTLKFKTREELDEDFADDFDTKAVKQVSFMRITADVTNWFGTYGSNGP